MIVLYIILGLLLWTAVSMLIGALFIFLYPEVEDIEDLEDARLFFSKLSPGARIITWVFLVLMVPLTIVCVVLITADDLQDIFEEFKYPRGDKDQ